MLDKGERMLFARLAVFSGGSTLEAIEAVCDAEGDLPVDVLEGVSSLLDKSLLRQEEGLEGEPRFVMLETIHEFALEKLEQSGEAEAIKRVHAEYFLDLGGRSRAKAVGPGGCGMVGPTGARARQHEGGASLGDGARGRSSLR